MKRVFKSFGLRMTLPALLLLGLTMSIISNESLAWQPPTNNAPSTEGTGFCLSCLFGSGSQHQGSQRYQIDQRLFRGTRSSYNCPRGYGHLTRYCPSLERTIASVLGPSQVKCYSNLFGIEGRCDARIVHHPRQAHNPYVGFGLCAIELSPVIRRMNHRGPACNNINSVAGQIRCCQHLMVSTHGRYFGPVRCGNTPYCGGH